MEPLDLLVIIVGSWATTLGIIWLVASRRQ